MLAENEPRLPEDFPPDWVIDFCANCDIWPKQLLWIWPMQFPNCPWIHCESTRGEVIHAYLLSTIDGRSYWAWVEELQELVVLTRDNPHHA